MAGPKEPITARSEYHFPWGWVALALAASFILGMAAWQYLGDGRIDKEMLATGAIGVAYALYGLRRAARAPQAIMDQMLAWREGASEAEASPSRPAP